MSQQTIGIPVGTNCAPLLADLFLSSYEAEFIQRLLRSKKISNDQELIQSDPISCPQNQKGNN